MNVQSKTLMWYFPLLQIWWSKLDQNCKWQPNMLWLRWHHQKLVTLLLSAQVNEFHINRNQIEISLCLRPSNEFRPTSRKFHNKIVFLLQELVNYCQVPRQAHGRTPPYVKLGWTLWSPSKYCAGSLLASASESVLTSVTMSKLFINTHPVTFYLHVEI